MVRRLSLPQTPISTIAPHTIATSTQPPTAAFTPHPPVRMNSSGSSPKTERRQLPLRPCLVNAHQYRNPHARLSQPDLNLSIEPRPNPESPRNRRVLPAGHLNSAQVVPHALPRRYLKRAHQSDLAYRFQRQNEVYSNESTPSREIQDLPVDPVYLALKQATGRYGGRRGSSANPDSQTPSPRNLSQASLHDSGYVEMSTCGQNPLLGSTPQLDNAGRSGGRRRAPKLSEQMKSLSLDCHDMPPRIQAATRSPIRSKLAAQTRGKGSSDISDWDRSCSPCTTNSRRASTQLSQTSGHIVIHEYISPNGGVPLLLGDRVRVVDNGDPDWLHGFRIGDRTERLMSFPATCVAAIGPGEQAMRILQNVLVPEHKLRLYRDQVVFAQPDTLIEGKVTVRTAHNAYAPCPLNSLALL